MKRNNMIIIGSLIAVVLVLVIGVFALNGKKSGSTKSDSDKETEEGIVLDTLPEDSWEIQDNSLTDEWGVVLRTEHLPEELLDAESYIIIIDGKEHKLEENMFDDSIYNGPVSNLEYTEEEVEKGTITKVEED